MEAFDTVDISYRVRGDTLVTWALNPLFRSANPGPYTFTVVSSLSGAGDWVEVGEVTDGYFILDSEKRVYGRGPWPIYYVTVVSSNGVEKVSKAARAWGNFTPHDRPIVKEILRKELILASKAGRCGVLFKRRHWGEPCPENINQDTGEIIPGVQGDDPCYGTGFLGGYFDPVECWMIPSKRAQKESRRLGIDLTRGHTELDGLASYWRSLTCPYLETDDVWVDLVTDKRYFVGRVWNLDFRGTPIIVDPVELKMAAADDIVYSLPVT